MTYSLPNGEVRYAFEDLVSRNGYTTARAVFRDIITTTDTWVNPETGETGPLDSPERLDESALFDEVGWQDLCDRADEISAGSWGHLRPGDEIWRVRQAVQQPKR